MHSKQPVIVEWGFFSFWFDSKLLWFSLFRCLFPFKCNLRLHHSVNSTDEANQTQTARTEWGEAMTF